MAEKFPGVVKDSPHTLLPVGNIAQAGCQKIDIALDLGGDDIGLQHSGPGRCQLNGQGCAFDQPADAHHITLLTGQ